MWCLLALSLSQSEPRPAPVKSSHVVLFLVDDLGWQDTSLSFGVPEKLMGRQVRTPQVAALAQRGLTIRQGYSACTVCTPSRVSILTGQHPARNRITSWVSAPGQDTGEKYPGLTLPTWETGGFQPGTTPTLAEVFKSAGYRTVQIGKAHFAGKGTAGANPTNLGFDRTIGGSSAGHPSSFYGTENFARRPDGTTPPPVHDVPNLEAYHGQDIYLEEALAKEAVKEIDTSLQAGRRMFIWYAPFAVHTPIQANKRLLEHYEGMNPTEAAYATMMESVDNAIGEVLGAFAKHGQLDQTIVVFTSDNGGLSQSSRGGYPNLHNLPLRSGKGSAYEGGVRVPLVMAGPNIPQADWAKAALVGTDLHATMASLAGIKAAPGDGEDWAERIQANQDSARTTPIVWHFPHHRGWGGPGLEPYSAMRLGDFRVIFYYGTRRWELYNLANDLGETRDLSVRQPERLKEMGDRLRQELERMNAQWPVDESTGQDVRPIVP